MTAPPWANCVASVGPLTPVKPNHEVVPTG
jgi:hypothetical protein